MGDAKQSKKRPTKARSARPAGDIAPFGRRGEIPQTVRDRIAGILSLPAARRIDALAEASDAAELLPAIDADVLAVTVLEAGVDRFSALAALATEDQIRHLVDLGFWRGGDLDVDAAVEIITAVGGADGDAETRWLATADDSLVVAVFSRLAIVTTDDASFPAKLYEREVSAPFSLDGVFTFWPLTSRHEGFLRSFLTRVYVEDQEGYRHLASSIQHAVESDAEADALALRERRLIEFGFPPAGQAAELFAPLPPERTAPVRSFAESGPPAAGVSAAEAIVRAPSDIPGDAPFLGRCAVLLPPDERLALRAALDRAGRLLLSAEFGDPGDLDRRREALRRAALVVSIGLEHLSGGEPPLAAAILVERPVVELFRVGHAVTRELFLASVRVRRSRCFESVPAVRGLLEPEILGVIDAAARPVPQRHVGLGPDGRPRREPFRSLAEVAEAHRVLDLAGALSRLLVDGLGVSDRFEEEIDLRDCVPSSVADLRAGDLLRTAIVRGAARGSLRFEPVTPDDVARLLERATQAGRGGRRFRRAFRDKTVDAVLARLPDATDAERSALESYLSAALDSLEDEIRGLDPAAPIDLRFVGGVARVRSESREEE